MSVAALIDHAGAILVAGGLLDQAAPFDEAAYQAAVEERYQFFSYGDAMLLERA